MQSVPGLLATIVDPLSHLTFIEVANYGVTFSGENTTTMLQVAGSELLDPASLSIDVLNGSESTVYENIKVEPMADAKSIFRGTMKIPAERFRIRLKGLMKNGQNFTRYSRVSFKESNMVVLTIKAGYEYTATIGNATAPVYVYLYSKAATGIYNLTASSTYGSIQTNPSSVSLRKGTNTTVTLQHNLPNNAQQLVGKIVTITLRVISISSSEQKDHKIKMMYVP